jgi:hypothetical protein
MGNAVRILARVVLASLLLASMPAVASPLATPAGADATAFSSEPVKPGLHRIVGPGGSTLLRIGSRGLVVVDAHRAGTYESLMVEIHRVAKDPRLPVQALVLTAAGPDPAGSIARFLEAGVPVIVQRRAAQRLAASAPALGVPPARPTAYDTDYLLRAGDVEAQIEHVGSGRTGADSVVLFPDLRVMAVGELYTAGDPEPDCASGGSFAGWAAAISHVLWSDFDVAVPSRGAPVGKPELRALRARLDTLARSAGSSPSGRADCRPQR